MKCCRKWYVGCDRCEYVVSKIHDEFPPGVACNIVGFLVRPPLYSHWLFDHGDTFEVERYLLDIEHRRKGEKDHVKVLRAVHHL